MRQEGLSFCAAKKLRGGERSANFRKTRPPFDRPTVVAHPSKQVRQVVRGGGESVAVARGGGRPGDGARELRPGEGGRVEAVRVVEGGCGPGGGKRGPRQNICNSGPGLGGELLLLL